LLLRRLATCTPSSLHGSLKQLHGYGFLEATDDIREAHGLKSIRFRIAYAMGISLTQKILKK